MDTAVVHLCANCTTPILLNQSGNASSPHPARSDADTNYWSINENVGSLFIEPPRIIALVLGFFAISLNLMTLLVFVQIKHKAKIHLKLIASLAASDIIIGVSVILHFMTTAINPNYYPGMGPPSGRLLSRCLFTFTKAMNSTGLNISLLNLTAMAFDHYMAITKPLKYLPQNRKSGLGIGVMWITSVILGFSDFFTGNRVYQRRKPLYNYCEAVYLSLYQDEYTVFAVGSITSIIMLYIYIRIYSYVRRHQLPGESYTNSVKYISKGSTTGKQVTPSNRKSNLHSGKALKTTLLILGTFFMCWTPTCLYQVGLIIQVKKDSTKLLSWTRLLYALDQYFLDLLLLNSVIDPVIYAIRIRDIQLGYRRMFHRCFWKRPYFDRMSSRTGTCTGIEGSITSHRPVPNATELQLLHESSSQL